MGRHKQIESILLRELTLGEDRAKRALTVIQHQQLAISDLEKSLQEEKKLCEQLQEEAKGLDQKIQDEVLAIKESLKEVKKKQSQLFVSDESLNRTVGNVDVAASGDRIEVSVQTSEISDIGSIGNINGEVSPGVVDAVHVEHCNISESVFEDLKQEVTTIKGELESRSEKEIALKRKLSDIRRKVKWLKNERDDVISFLGELSGWKQRVEGILLDLSAGINENASEVDSVQVVSEQTQQIQVWRTARRFFNADEAHFFLT